MESDDLESCGIATDGLFGMRIYVRNEGLSFCDNKGKSLEFSGTADIRLSEEDSIILYKQLALFIKNKNIEVEI